MVLPIAARRFTDCPEWRPVAFWNLWVSSPRCPSARTPSPTLGEIGTGLLWLLPADRSCRGAERCLNKGLPGAGPPGAELRRAGLL